MKINDKGVKLAISVGLRTFQPLFLGILLFFFFDLCSTLQFQRSQKVGTEDLNRLLAATGLRHSYGPRCALHEICFSTKLIGKLCLRDTGYRSEICNIFLLVITSYYQKSKIRHRKIQGQRFFKKSLITVRCLLKIYSRVTIQPILLQGFLSV